jgi:hypothetical protein
MVSTRRFMALGLLLVSTTSLVTCVEACKKAEASPAIDKADRFVVHEWGTFTSFQGANGVSVEGLQHETESLPQFVHSRVDPRTSPLAVYGDQSRDVPVRRCTGKMETPVIYFHSATQRRVKVHVGFEGLLTQWYPAASGAAPAFTGAEQHDLGAIEKSSLDWDLDILPRGVSSPANIPQVEANSDWQKAREVDAAYVRTTSEAEQYVFYRGLMRSVVQPNVLPRSADAVTIVNATPNPIAALFVLDMKKATGRFASAVGPLVGARDVSLAAVPERSKPEVVADVERAMTTALVAQGLYADEARAMVRTWSETWFTSEGTRVLYLVPRPVTERALPLTITPAPDELVRVMVGRVEFLAPAKEAELSTAMLAVSSPNERQRDEAFARIATHGRFVEPAVRSVAQRNPGDPRMATAAATILARLAMH